jgi:hypothetical protein
LSFGLNGFDVHLEFGNINMKPAHQYAAYGPEIASLLSGVAPAPLDKGRPNEKFRATLAALTPENIFAETGRPIRDARMAQCGLAGLWLRHNFFDESHALSQEIETTSGSFWHAILHRREPDYDNAGYWFRRVGTHPIFPALNDAANAAGWPKSTRWDALTFVSQVGKAVSEGAESATAKLCVQVQQLEWELLFEYCWKQAIGAG